MTILAVLVILGVGGLLFLAGYGLRLLVGRRQLGSAERHA